MDSNIEKVWHLLLQNRHRSLRMIVDERDISKDTVGKIVIENEGGRESFLMLCTTCINRRTEGR